MNFGSKSWKATDRQRTALDRPTQPAVVVGDPLFKDRAPEAAARQLAIVLAWLTECDLATLEMLQERKSTSRRDLIRQMGICDRAVDQCHDLGVQPYGLNGHFCQRLADRLSQKIKKANP